MFRSLVRDEQEHKYVFQVEYERLEAGQGWMEVNEAKSQTPKLSLLPPAERLELSPKATDFEVLEMAMNFKRTGIEMYQQAAQQAPEATAQAVYLHLAGMEKKHLELLQKNLNHLSATGTWLLLDKEKPMLDGG